ncbi:MAG TPA: AAA family ATPase, partial [Methylomicrobium sp.]|nr:AAA family ATPase [Methylomicrobium sp.]
MVEIDSDTYQIKMMQGENAVASPRFLMTPERQQNLELLQHLLENTDRSIVLCGPEGVGKTALLEFLKKRVKDEFQWCSFKGHAGLAFEEIHEHIGPFLRHSKLEFHVKTFGQNRSHNLHKNIVLMVDDAGDITPGLATKMIHLAEDHPDLRIIFVLTYDQWHIKNCTDPAIENCYIVEMNPFALKECMDFVQHLASLAPRLRFRNGITDSMIDAIYLETHGIPSRIIAHFPELNKGKESAEPLIILILAVTGLVTLALAVQWFTASRPVIEQGDPSTTSDSGSRARVI